MHGTRHDVNHVAGALDGAVDRISCRQGRGSHGYQLGDECAYAVGQSRIGGQSHTKIWIGAAELYHSPVVRGVVSEGVHGGHGKVKRGAGPGSRWCNHSEGRCGGVIYQNVATAAVYWRGDGVVHANGLDERSRVCCLQNYVKWMNPVIQAHARTSKRVINREYGLTVGAIKVHGSDVTCSNFLISIVGGNCNLK